MLNKKGREGEVINSPPKNKRTKTERVLLFTKAGTAIMEI